MFKGLWEDALEAIFYWLFMLELLSVKLAAVFLG